MNTNGHCFRSRSPEVFCKIGVPKNFAKFTGKHLRWSIFINKVAGWRPGTLSIKRPRHSCFPVNFTKFLRAPPMAASIVFWIGMNVFVKTQYFWNSNSYTLLFLISPKKLVETIETSFLCRSFFRKCRLPKKEILLYLNHGHFIVSLETRTAPNYLLFTLM